jgi:transglutaminase-like putative cysteine protease
VQASRLHHAKTAMPTDTAFRLSMYLTLAFSCAALGYAEYTLLPEVAFIAGGVFVALIVLYRLETRVELLSIPAANRLGVVVGLAILVWAVFRVLREVSNPEMLNMNWGVLGVAMIGPLVMTLMPAKLARREKHAGDYWWLHGLALATASLAGAMAEDVVAFVLLGLYAACAVWSLTLFYFLRASGSVLPVPGQTPGVPVAGVVAAGRPRSGLSWALGFAVLAALVTGPMYLLTPRSPWDKLEFGKPRVEIGYAADQMVDLTQTGDLQANPQVAFEVTAETEAGPKTDLSPSQRWRGRTMRRYQNGLWQPGDTRLPSILPSPNQTRTWTPPELGPGQCTLKYTLYPAARGRFLADPVAWAGGQSPPIAHIQETGYRPWIWVGDGSFLSEVRLPRGGSASYLQVWRQEADSDLSPPFRINDPDRDAVLRQLRYNPVPKVKEYADRLIARLIRDRKLPPDPWDPVTLLPRLEFHDLIARAFTAHLATAPEFTYTTDLRREKKNLDPIEEFLFHTRAGHCERFATALVLLLRSQGIPAILVLGFMGCEQTDEPGKYIVRQEHAHAWVEALIEQYEPRPWWDVWGVRLRSRWRSLDPTPGGEPAESGQGGWVDRAGTWLRSLYNTFVANYDAEQRRRALAAVGSWATRTETIGTAAALVAAAVLLRYSLRRRPVTTPPTPETRWFDWLLAVLAAHGFIPEPGQTPREFAAGVTESLRRNPAAVSLADVPLDWVEAYYETRFGGHPLPPDRLAALESRLDDLKRALS